MIEKGAIISEYPLGTRPTIYRAIKRNRSIALWSNEIVTLDERQPGISRAIVYAAHTYKRPVYTLLEPERVTGTKERNPPLLHRVFSPHVEVGVGTSSPIGSNDEQICIEIVDLLQYVPMPTEELANALQLQESHLLTLLIDMELNGTISYRKGGRWQTRIR